MERETKKRKLAMILAIAMLMTMFAGLDTASAATTYTSLNVPVISPGLQVTDLGIIEVKIDNVIRKS